MADVTLNPEEITRSGLDATDNVLNTTDVYKVPNDGRVELHFRKTGAGACTITVATPGTVDGLAVADRTITVPATTGDVRAGPWPRADYNDSQGRISFTASEATGLTCAVVRLP